MTPITHIRINGTTYALTDRLGGGLEAEVWRVSIKGTPVALKLFLVPTHPSFTSKPNADDLRKRAQARLDEHQKKLPAYPENIPEAIIRPKQLITDADDRIVGYAMDLLPDGFSSSRLFSDPTFRRDNGVTNVDILKWLIELHDVITEGHRAKLIFGDGLSGNNVQFGKSVKGVKLIDADSIITPGYPNRTHTRECVDPLLCRVNELVMNKDHTVNSDWFVFCVMVAWYLTLVHPYADGIYAPDDEMSDEERAHGGISTFNPKVILPDGAIKIDRLPDDLVAYLTKVFERKHRGPFPLHLLQNMVWTTCACGTEHGRTTCPTCGTAVVGEGMRQGTAEATDLFAAPGFNIVSVAGQLGNPRYAFVDGDNIHRDGTDTVLTGAYSNASVEVLISNSLTGVRDGGTLTIYNEDGTVSFKTDDVSTGDTVTDSNSSHVYWLTSLNDVMRNDNDGSVRLGRVSGPPARMWAGEKFVLSFWRELASRVTIFNSENPGIIAAIPLPTVPGNLADAHCVFSSQVAWLFLTLERGGQNYNYCYIIGETGKILASADATAGDGSWLGADIRLHTATGARCYTPTPAGLVRAELKKGSNGYDIVVSEPHTDSAPFVASASALVVAGGIVVLNANILTRLVNRTN